MSKRFIPLADLDTNEKIWLFSIAQMDLHLAVQRAELAIERAGAVGDRWGVDGAYSAFHDATVATYMRPFTGCDMAWRRGKTCLPASYAASDTDGRLAEMHGHIKSTRDQFIAHSDLSVKDVTIQPMPIGTAGPSWYVESSTGLLQPGQLGALRVCARVAFKRVTEERRLLVVDFGANLVIGEKYSLRELTRPPS